MATPSSPTTGESPNHQPSATMGGASAFPTPANNVGGGKGWGDKGFRKGGMDGPGHVHSQSALDFCGNFLGLEQQKSFGESNHSKRAESAGYGTQKTKSGYPTCENEDHSFMNHRPGCPGTLPGWSKTKNFLEM
ncbi:hypothetical protein ASPWEDRAFT_176973 [Aspergillus wentii DTO 134E9]|uniref:Uncharacterized protein n=1 Tax=Aspergillus wentii DTO 134E9 TaxID=1073089 RepID=A0A1L9R601_ASPWE|nr:uncharacterized protein ASPWEDRAFT_176973 [Aspergillus wentii DTO 134E9]OJJ30308.1 hypothetical protein ASPWEDRAFT_176973 [Aspergillus wentii DTO 134E9]